MSDELKNDMSFSASRESLLDECERRFFYAVYLMWDGWWRRDRKPEARRAEAYNSKLVTTEVFFAGKVVHEMAEWAIRQAQRDGDFLRRWGGREGVRDHMQTLATKRIDEALVQARSDVRGNPKKWVKFVSHNNGLPIEEAFLRDRVRTRIEALCAQDELWDNGVRPSVNLLLRALANARNVVHVEELIQWQVASQWGPVKAFLAHDLVMRNSRDPNACVILDWKTGKESDENGDQLDFYAAWGRSNGWSKVDTALVYLGDGKTTVHWTDADLDAAMQRTVARVDRYVGRLREKLVARDIERNEAIESAFVPTTDASKCRYCPFSHLCEREGTKPR